ncbi:MAG: F0F1 ATP synthase subunit epsilon [Chloroflexi bacterium]|nr:F0F1 ATP synthase subunit epsilon [Chloroflexota bacterium]
MAKLRLDIVTAERLVYSDDVDVLVAPGIEGELGILPRHAPLLTALTVGELRIRKEGQETYFAIGGGFLEVRPNRVIVLADVAERAEEIDQARAEAARQRAQERLARGLPPADAAAAIAALHRATLRLRVARRRARRSGPAIV